jgi:hypothetical protein
VPKIHEPHQAYSPVFLTKQYTHKFHQYNRCSRLKKHRVNRCVTLRSEDREIIASSTRSNERRQAPGPSVHFREETYTNGDLRNEGQKTQAERLKLQPENWNYRPHAKVISRYMRRSSAGSRIWVALYSQVGVP